MEKNYYKVTFNITDANYVSPYAPARKIVFFTATSEHDVDTYIRNNSIHGNGAYKYTIEPCKKEDLAPYPTDGFYCVILPKNDVIGSIDITEREWLVRWELREHDGEYAKVLRRVNFIASARDAKTAGKIADDYAIRRRYCYGDDYTYYTITEDTNTINALKKSGDFVKI